MPVFCSVLVCVSLADACILMYVCIHTTTQQVLMYGAWTGNRKASMVNSHKGRYGALSNSHAKLEALITKTCCLSFMVLAVRAWSAKHVRHSDRNRIPCCHAVMMHCTDADSLCKVYRIPSYKISQGMKRC